MNSKSYNPWIIVILVCLGILAPNYAQFQLSALGPRFISSLNISPSQFSAIMTGPLVPGIFLSLISGLMVDRFGARRIILFGFLASAAGAIIRVFASSFPSVLISMVLIGVTATFMNSNSSKIFGHWFPSHKIGIVMGIFLAVANAAMALGMGTGALFPSIRSAFISSALICSLAAVAWLLFARDKSSSHSNNSAAVSATPSTPIRLCLKAVLKSKGVWFTSFSLMFMCAGGVSISMFLPTALSSRGFEEAAAGAIGMSSTIGAMLSCFLTPFLNSKINKPKSLMLSYGLLGALGTAFAWRAPFGPLLILALFLTGFLTTGLSPILMSIPIQLPEIGPLYAGTAGGFVATIQLLGSVLIPTYILTPISGDNYNLLFLLFASIMLLFCISVFFLPKLNSHS